MAYAHGRGAYVYVDEFNISGRSSSAEVSPTVETADVTGMGGSVAKSYIAGLADCTATINGFLYSGDGDVEDVITDYWSGGETALLTVCPKGVADSAPCYLLRDAICTAATPSANLSGAVALNHTWQSVAGAARLLVVYEGSPTASADGASIDFGAAGTAGLGEAVIHCTSVAGTGTIDVKLQESSDDDDADSWADVTGGAFTQLEDVGAERITWAAAAEQYVRAVITIAGFTACTLFVAAKT